MHLKLCRFAFGTWMLFSASTGFTQNPAVIVQVDVNASRKPINPLIYGVAHASTAALSDLNSPLNRNGGNNTSRYNWQLNADNRANDWYYESIGDSSSVAGERGDTFIANSKAAGAQAMLTIPLLDWVAKLGANRSKLASFSIAKYGPQTGSDWQWFPDAGNGVLQSTGQFVVGNNPTDANVASSASLQQGWVQHLINRWGAASNGGLRYYILDNEHSIWHSTHRDVQPTGATMDQVRDKMIAYAGSIKSVDPSALVVGPEEWGWSGYFYSGYDQQWGSKNGWSNLPDRGNHGGADYVPWLLAQLRQHEVNTGQRLLDVFTLHYYPQGGEFSDNVTSSMQLRRNRSTRSLWDPNYVDETWINDRVKLIPRMKSWVNTYCPNTVTGITEYNWGAEGHINGATTQADIWGIFGREGLDMAARWTTPAASTPTYKAMKMYRNYDGSKSTFGDVSVQATVPTPDNLSAFAAERSSDGAVTVMVINKVLSDNTPVTVALSNVTTQGVAQVWQLTSANAINHLPDISFAGSNFSTPVPPQSITLFVVPTSDITNQPPTAVIAANPTSGSAPLAVAFNGSGSSDLDGTITSYAWNFGDGATGTGATVSHTYSVAGTFTATLTVTDNGNATSTASAVIVVASTQINAPTNLTGSSSNRVVTLRWSDNSNNEEGFTIERAVKAKGTTVFAAVGQAAANATSYSETVASGTYLYRVRAFNLTTGKVSSYSNQVQLRVR
ncbi:MAG TPA: glycoside hydrolase family 44 protein [Terriglobia bacterium]|nr:glycoside hydrolase family 44 protein [Terriglobia bacterium]